MTAGYMGETAEQAGLATQFISIYDIGWDTDRRCFVDLENEPIRQLLKLYPWEWMAEEEFGQHCIEQSWHVFEPAWKIVCSSKAFLLLVQEMSADHPNLLRVSREAGDFASFVRKPYFGREGSNIELVREGQSMISTSGPYAEDPAIYQEYCPLIRQGEAHAQLGVWMIGDEARGLGVREDNNAILRNTSRFVPHIIT